MLRASSWSTIGALQDGPSIEGFKRRFHILVWPDPPKQWRLARHLEDNSIAVGLFNRGEEAAWIAFTWERLGLGGKKLQARDLWAHQDLEASGDRYTAAVSRHGVGMLRLSAR